MKALWGSESPCPSVCVFGSTRQLRLCWPFPHSVQESLKTFSLAPAAEVTAVCTWWRFNFSSPAPPTYFLCLPQLLNTSNTSLIATAHLIIWIPQLAVHRECLHFYSYLSTCIILTSQIYLFIESSSRFTARGPKILLLLWVEIEILCCLL